METEVLPEVQVVVAREPFVRLVLRLMGLLTLEEEEVLTVPVVWEATVDQES